MLSVAFLLIVKQRNCDPDHYGPFSSINDAEQYFLEGRWTGDKEYVESWEVTNLYYPK